MAGTRLGAAARDIAWKLQASRLACLAVLLCLAGACQTGPDTGREITGQAAAIDGDTLELADTRIRLYGIDAPQDDQTCDLGGVTWRCGKHATKALDGLVRGWLVSCTTKTRRDDSTVAVCRAGGRDINAAMVSSGMALAYERHGEDYAEAEAAARAARRGLWASRFVPPREWRRRKH